MTLMENKIKNLEYFYQENFFNRQELKTIFSWDELEYILNLRPFVNDKRFFILSEESYKWDASPWLTDPNTYPPSLINDQIKKSLCLIIDCSRVSKGVNKIANYLENITNSSVDAHIFFSLTNDKQGFGIHSDKSHNFILQIEGETNFKVWGIKNEEKKRHNDKIDQKPVIDVVMRPGDCIFIPAYYWHIAESNTNRLSISFPMSVEHDSVKEDREWIKLNP